MQRVIDSRHVFLFVSVWPFGSVLMCAFVSVSVFVSGIELITL